MRVLDTYLRMLVVVMMVTAAAVCLPDEATAQRRVSPVNNAATATQPVNETKNDTARINAARRARSIHHHDDEGRVIFIDTVTGEQWIDSTALIRKIPMKYPTIMAANVGVNIWDPVMRAFGQKYGIADAFAQLNMHNRYFPTVEVGLGTAHSTPAGLNYTYTSPLSVYFRLGIDYNFLYNSNPDYQFFAGVRYGFSPFTFALTDVNIDSGYWGEDTSTSVPSQSVTAGWFELCFGLRVKIWGPVSAGWMFKYHSVLHQSKCPYGDPWYIPGYGSAGSNITGAFSVVCTIDLTRHRPAKADPPENKENQ